MVREQYRALPEGRLEACAGYSQPEPKAAVAVTLESPALETMTDLKQIRAISIGPDAKLASANKAMLRNNVRSLLVADERRCLLGIITSTDLLGERPMQFVRERGVRHEEIQVRDVMTPRERLEVLAMEDVRSAAVGHIVATLKRAGRQHALVAEEDVTGRQMVCGIFSASQIARQLGVPLQTHEIAATFAEIEAAIAH